MRRLSLSWCVGAPVLGLVLWFPACLNPRPEDFPSRHDTDPAGSSLANPDVNGSGEGAGSGAVSGRDTGGDTPADPAAPPAFAAPSEPDADAGADAPIQDAGADAQ